MPDGDAMTTEADELAARATFKAELVKDIDAAMRRKVLDVMTDVQTHMRIEATKSSLDYIRPHLGSVVLKRRRSDLWEMAIAKAAETKVDGLLLEFGVFHGLSINFFAKKIRTVAHLRDKQFHGFDSFEGLPELWRHRLKSGALSLHGELPEVEKNVVLHKGWFSETVPPFATANPGPVTILHFDADLYASAKTVFECFGPRIGTGTVILMDNYLNYFGWQDHEHKAFAEAVRQFGWKYRYLAFNCSGWNYGQALIEII